MGNENGKDGENPIEEEEEKAKAELEEEFDVHAAPPAKAELDRLFEGYMVFLQNFYVFEDLVSSSLAGRIRSQSQRPRKHAKIAHGQEVDSCRSGAIKSKVEKKR